jgi:hypothetical protein
MHSQCIVGLDMHSIVRSRAHEFTMGLKASNTYADLDAGLVVLLIYTSAQYSFGFPGNLE